MRRLFTTEQFLTTGGLQDQLTAMIDARLCVRVRRGVYAEGPDEPDAFTLSLARMVAHRTPVWGLVAARMQNFDGIEVTQEIRRRHQSTFFDAATVTVSGYECTGALQTLIDIAPSVSDDQWEQALEFTLRKKLVVLGDLEALLPRLARSRVHGVARIRRVLAQRPTGAPPTESILETMFVQAARRVPNLGPPTRQFVVYNRHGRFVARVDLAWPELGIFIELDGQGHADQPVYDAARQTAVAVATGWLVGRYTWRQVKRTPRWCARQLEELVNQALLRPLIEV